MPRTSWLSSEQERLQAGLRIAMAALGNCAVRCKAAAKRVWTQIVYNWKKLSLVKRFVIISSAVVLLGMVTIGLWVSKKIEHGVTQYSAATAALYVDGLISPLAQELAAKDTISQTSADKIDGIIKAQRRSGSQIVAVKLWKRGGVVAYSTWTELIGKKFTPTENLKQAWQGVVSSEYDHVTHEDGSIERGEGQRLLEVYAPILSNATGEIAAVSEFYISAEALSKDLAAATAQTWLVVGGTTAAIVLALSGLVLGANATIERQSQAMQGQIVSLRDLVNQNEELRNRIQRAYMRSTNLNERLFRRLGSDLHDGPAQLLGLALIRLDSLYKKPANGKSGKASPNLPSPDLEIVRGALQDAMQEIRNLSSGFALPQLDRMNLEEVVQLVVRNHEKRTGTSVKTDFRTDVGNISNTAKECIYRFLQEALNNSFRHAAGRNQQIYVFDQDDHLIVRARDSGPGMGNRHQSSPEHGLGLKGLEDRVQAIGGDMKIDSSRRDGTTLTARFDPQHIRTQEPFDAG